MRTLKVAKVNKTLRPPSYKEIPRIYAPLSSEPEHQSWLDQKDFDRRVFQALMVGGVGENTIPTDGVQMLSLIVGGIRIVCCDDIVTPETVRPTRRRDGLWQLWSLGWEALSKTNLICPTIKESLERLLVPDSESESHGNERHSYNRLLKDLWESPNGLWWCQNYYRGYQNISSLTDQIRKQGPGLEFFSAEEQRSIENLIMGIAQVVEYYRATTN